MISMLARMTSEDRFGPVVGSVLTAGARAGTFTWARCCVGVFAGAGCVGTAVGIDRVGVGVAVAGGVVGVQVGVGVWVGLWT
jgi:hypothetical protein